MDLNDSTGRFPSTGRAKPPSFLDLIFDKSDPGDTARAHAAFKEGMLENAKLGYGVYRTNIAFMDLAADTYGPAQRAFNKQLKQALDPNGIIAPGKSGIFN